MRRGFFLGPLYSLFLLRRDVCAVPEPTGMTAWLTVLGQARRTALEPLLPAAPVAEVLGLRLATAARKLDEMDRLLAKPEFCEEAAQSRSQALARAGDALAAGLVRLRLQQIARLQAQREHLAAELEDVRELLAQLASQAEAVRHTGACNAGTRELVAELLRRMHGLDRPGGP